MKFFDFNSNRTYGIEIEIADLGTDARHAQAEINRTVGHGWIVKGDPSLRDMNNRPYNPRSVEIVSPPLSGTNGRDKLKAVCDLLEGWNARVNKTCGLHVHHDITDMDWRGMKKILAVTKKYEEVLFAGLPPSRSNGYTLNGRPAYRGGQWCKMTPEQADAIDAVGSKVEFWALVRSARHGDRYFGLNWNAYDRHGTIEFRYHSGTVEFEKIWNWTVLTQAIVEAGKRLRSFKAQYTDRDMGKFSFKLQWFADTIGIKSSRRKTKVSSEQYLKTYNWLLSRIRTFNPDKVARVKPVDVAEGYAQVA